MKKIIFLIPVFLVSLNVFGKESNKNWNYADFKLHQSNVSYSDMYNCLKKIGLDFDNSIIAYNKVGSNTGILQLKSDGPKICVIPQGKEVVNCIIDNDEGALFKTNRSKNEPKFTLLVVSKKYGYEYSGYAKNQTELEKIKNGQSFVRTPELYEKVMMGMGGHANPRIEHYSQTSNCVESVNKIDDEVNSSVFDHLVTEIKNQKEVYDKKSDDVFELYDSRECKKFVKIFEDVYPSFKEASNDCPQCAIAPKGSTTKPQSSTSENAVKSQTVKSVIVGPGASKGK